MNGHGETTSTGHKRFCPMDHEARPSRRAFLSARTEPAPASVIGIRNGCWIPKSPSELRQAKSKAEDQQPLCAVSAALKCSDHRKVSAYATSDDVVIYLISQSVNGSPEKRLAARFILDCLRTWETPEEFEVCFHNVDDDAILDVAEQAQEMAASLGLIRQ